MLELNCFTFKLKLQLDCLVSIFAVSHVLLNQEDSSTLSYPCRIFQVCIKSPRSGLASREVKPTSINLSSYVSPARPDVILRDITLSLTYNGLWSKIHETSIVISLKFYLNFSCYFASCASCFRTDKRNRQMYSIYTFKREKNEDIFYIIDQTKV